MKDYPGKSIVSWYLKRRYPVSRSMLKKVAIMVPLPHLNLSEEERISLAHLEKYLGNYEKIMLAPQGMNDELPGFRSLKLSKRYFGSAASHNRMLFVPDFWQLFRDYEFVLMYHPDALVFRDELLEWCDRGVDFIGAPWVKSEHTPWVENERCGNGGFALYRISSVMEVLINRHLGKPSLIWIDRFAANLDALRKRLVKVKADGPRWLRKVLGERLDRWIHKLEFVEVNRRPNDYFWAIDAVNYKSDFRVGSLEEGLRFAFEADPAGCFERTSGNLPFGAHAWGRYDRKFWEPYLFPGSRPSCTPVEGEI